MFSECRIRIATHRCHQGQLKSLRLQSWYLGTRGYHTTSSNTSSTPRDVAQGNHSPERIAPHQSSASAVDKKKTIVLDDLPELLCIRASGVGLPKRTLLKRLLQPLLIRAVGLLSTGTLLELDSVLCDGDGQLALGIIPAIAGIAEVLRLLELLERDCDDTVGFFVVKSDLGILAELLCFVAHVLLDLKQSSGVLVELFEGEGVLDDADLGPFVLLGRECLLNLVFVIRPLIELAIWTLALATDMC